MAKLPGTPVIYFDETVCGAFYSRQFNQSHAGAGLTFLLFFSFGPR